MLTDVVQNVALRWRLRVPDPLDDIVLWDTSLFCFGIEAGLLYVFKYVTQVLLPNS